MGACQAPFLAEEAYLDPFLAVAAFLDPSLVPFLVLVVPCLAVEASLKPDLKMVACQVEEAYPFLVEEAYPFLAEEAYPFQVEEAYPYQAEVAFPLFQAEEGPCQSGEVPFQAEVAFLAEAFPWQVVVVP